jgi:hypothetical protein
MTEAEWLNGTDLAEMLDYVREGEGAGQAGFS